MATTTDLTKMLRTFNILSIDATEPLKVTITKGDCKRGRRGAPSGCVIAGKMLRSCQGLQAHIFSRIAHVLQADPKIPGRMINVRYTIDRYTRDAILNYDKGKDFVPGVYTLRPLVRSERKDKKEIRDVKRKSRPSGDGSGVRYKKHNIHVRRFSGNFTEIGV